MTDVRAEPGAKLKERRSYCWISDRLVLPNVRRAVWSGENADSDQQRSIVSPVFFFLIVFPRSQRSTAWIFLALLSKESCVFFIFFSLLE